MRLWDYVGFTNDGKVVSSTSIDPRTGDPYGPIQAESSTQASAVLKASGLNLRSISAADGGADGMLHPNTAEVAFSDMLGETPPGEIKARILPPEPKMEPKPGNPGPAKESPKVNEAAAEGKGFGIGTDRDAAPIQARPEIKPLGKKEANLLKCDLEKAIQIIGCLREQGCPEEIQAKVRIALIIEAAKRRL